MALKVVRLIPMAATSSDFIKFFFICPPYIKLLLKFLLNSFTLPDHWMTSSSPLEEGLFLIPLKTLPKKEAVLSNKLVSDAFSFSESEPSFSENGTSSISGSSFLLSMHLSGFWGTLLIFQFLRA